MLDVNTEALEKYSKKLESISRSALPVAIRESLNDCAKDMKTNTLLKSAKDKFVNRSPNFFKANSKYDRATGFNIPMMKATVGMTEGGLKGGNNYAVKDLVQQEFGGVIEKKSFIPLNPARTGKSANKMVRASERLTSISKIVDARRAKGRNDKEKFVRSVYFAGKGGAVLSKFKGKTILWRVNSLNRTAGGKFKLTALYSFEKGRKVTVSATSFIETAGARTHVKIDDYYVARAEKAIAKYL